VKNPIFGSGQHSHEVPVIPGVVVEIGDGTYHGLVVRRDDGYGGRFLFVVIDITCSARTADRCVLVRGQKIDDIDPSMPYACDLESPDGLCFVGVDDEELGWLSEDAVVLWDSAHQVEDATDADHVIPIEQLALAEAFRFRSEHGLTDFDAGWAQRSWDRVLPTGTFDEWFGLIRKFYNQIVGEWI
jgi:hypothetical protein